jgi:hypothetical protein
MKAPTKYLLVFCAMGTIGIVGYRFRREIFGLNRPIPSGNEVAMKDGSTIDATSKVGKISIHAGPDLKRSYTWEGATRSVIMIPRSRRWYGSMGMYYPGSGNHWDEHNGITRGVLEEGQQDFDSEAEAQKWIKERDYSFPVWNNSGLLVGWYKVLSRNQLNVDVWQITIQHKVPTNFPGYTDGAIKVY